ncbi:unnamed protein product [marine sediment metagenome]|uniref:Uncharacterized protein n=1 Tax=marine sediment metagenome TaxID=412755 RepID=X0TG13_9ZZZZ
MKELTQQQKSKLFRNLFTMIFSAPTQALLPTEVRVTIPHEDMNQTVYFTRVDHPKLRGYECALPGNHVIIMEQNPKSASVGAFYAQQKYPCAWIWIQKEPYPRLERKWLAFMIQRINGEVCIFAGKHIMRRVDAYLKADTAGQNSPPE